MSANIASPPPIVKQLASTFRSQLHSALDWELDGSITSLAAVDHFITVARKEDRAPILTLLAAGAGAYFGELVREHIGGAWLAVGDDPRRMRLLLDPSFIHFSPVDIAFQAIIGQTLTGGDARLPDGQPFDPAFTVVSLPPIKLDESGEDSADDATWINERLAELPPIAEDQFHSLTGRFESLQLMIEMLATKHAGENRSPRVFTLDDYLSALAKIDD